MKFQTLELSNGKYSFKKLLLIGLTIILISLIPLCAFKNSNLPLPSLPFLPSSRINSGDEATKDCDIFSGKWVPNPKGPYYTNETCHIIAEQQNCVKYGRPDTDFMKWRWRPKECELPMFNAVQFLEIVRGKKMAFVGDSVGRNQMQSLLCLLSTATNPKDLSPKYLSGTTYLNRWYFTEYNFTVAAFWSPFLITARDPDPDGHSLNSIVKLYLDQPDESWTSHIEEFDYAIVSAVRWFYKPMTYYTNNQVIGSHTWDINTDLSMHYGYRIAYQTTFKTLLSLQGYKGITFLRTVSPAHFENGAWNAGGNCPRTRPSTKEELKLEGFELEFYNTQVEEFRKAQEEGKKKGLKFQLLATTEAMQLRPDGHPNYYRYAPGWNASIADCVHWCLPGPIDTWNEILLYMLKRNL